MAAPKTGRLFLRSHGDCFIHATAFFVKYWNFSLAQEGLGIVQVTVSQPEEHVFLACISPTPLPYEHVKKGMNHRNYLEIDPKFAAELGIAHDTEVVLEPVRSIERCLKFKVATKNPQDFDILYDNIEKVNYELTDRIRIVTCQTFFTFPIWINQDVIIVRVVNSSPSANWIMIIPDFTNMELQREGQDSEGDSTSITTVTTATTPSTPEDDTPFINMNASLNSHNLVAGSFPKDSRSKSANSAESSVDMESASGSDNWNIHSFLMRAQRMLSTGLRGSMNLGVGQGSTTGGIRETIQEGSDEIVTTEPGRGQRFQDYPFQSEEGMTMTHKNMLNSELKDKFATSLCVRGSNLTPEPITSVSPSRSGNVSEKPSHKRTATWHSESEFNSNSLSKNRRGHQTSRLLKLTTYVSTPRMHANIRVQPHTLKGLRAFHTEVGGGAGVGGRAGGAEGKRGLWSQRRAFDVFVHPSTLPEVYHYLQKKSTSGSFLVELIPIPQLNKFVSKSAESASKPDGPSENGGHGGKSDATCLPSSLVVRLCFATKVCVDGDNMSASVSEDVEHTAVTVEKKAEPVLSVPVEVGHVLMSDVVRQQLEIKECSRVKLLHVDDGWKMSFVDAIKVVIQPINYDKKDRFKDLLVSFRSWIRLVSDVSKFGAVLVDKQIITLEDDKGDQVNCQLNITSSRLLPHHAARISFCLLTPNDLEKKHVFALVDSVSNRSPANFRRPRVMPQSSHRGGERDGAGEPKLPAMNVLNQEVLSATPTHYGAFTDLLEQGTSHIRTVFMGRKRCGTLLVCGMSGSAGAGCGKSSLVQLIAKEAQAHPYHAFVQVANCTSFRSQTTARTKKRLLSLFSEAIQNNPSVLVLEDLDHVMPHVGDAQEQVQEEGNNSINKTQLFRDLLREARHCHAHLLVIATARNKQELNRELLTSQGAHTFDRVLEIQPPTLADRKEIVQAILERKGVPSFLDSDLRAVASRTEGFQAGDLVTLIDRALSHSELRVLCPAHSTPFDMPPDPWCRRMSMESGSDLSLSIELSSPPNKAFSSPSPQKAHSGGPSPHQKTGSTHPLRHLDLSNSLPDSGISSPVVIPQMKKMSVVSASSLTPTTPRNVKKVGVAPMSRVGSLSQMVLTVHDFVTALEGFVPISLRGLPLHTSGNVDFSHVGGLEKTKQRLRETLLWPIKYPKLFSQCTIKQRCGVMLYGAPGTGKTLLAGAVAKEFGLNFVSVKGPELLSKYIGASEKAVRDIFTRAQSAQPCILFFDEFDSLAPRRGHDNTGVTDRVVNQLLTQLDGVETLQGVYVLAASSRPDLIDPALLRPGRIDIKLFCNMPDENERYEILRTLSNDVRMSNDVNLQELAKASYTQDFTGADLKALLYNAQLSAVHKALDERRLKSRSRVSVTSEGSPDTSIKSGGGGHQSPMVFKWTEEGVQQQPAVPTDIELKVSMLEPKARRRRLMSTASDSLERSSSFTSRGDPGKGQQQVVVTHEYLLQAVQDIRPSVSKAERDKYTRIYDKFTGKAEPEQRPVDIVQRVTHA